MYSLPPVTSEEHPGEFVRVPDFVFDEPIGWRKAERLRREYGVSRRELMDESQHPTGKRVFYVNHLVPFKLTADELAHGDLRVIAAERRIRYLRLLKFRKTAKQRRKHLHESAPTAAASHESKDEEESPSASADRESDDSAAVAATPDTPLSSPSSTFSCDLPAAVADAAEPARWPSSLLYLCAQVPPEAHLVPSLRLLVSVAQERQTSAVDGEVHPALTGRLEVEPLPVLREAAAILTEAVERLDEDVIAQQEAVTAEAVAAFIHDQHNVYLFNVCLWQRRHPLQIAAFVMEMYHSGQLADYLALREAGDGGAGGAATVMSSTAPEGFEIPPSAVPTMDDLMEALTSSMYPELSSIPWLIRCDVLMTYPHMPFEEQLAMMAEVAAHVRHGANPVASHTCGSVREEQSAQAVSPQELLRGYLADADIPDRLSAGIIDSQFRALRAAFERHKRDGVQRLSRRAYS